MKIALVFAAFGAATSDAWISVNSANSRSCKATSLMQSEQRASVTASSTELGAVEVVGKGRIGSLFEADDVTFIGRNDKINPDASGPILLATRNDALDGIVENCPESRRKDLVFMQNGYLDNFLKSKGLLDNTQVLLYLSVPSLGAEPTDGVTSVNPEGLTAATGIHAQAFADRLASLNLKCKVVAPEQYRPAMFEKLM